MGAYAGTPTQAVPSLSQSTFADVHIHGCHDGYSCWPVLLTGTLSCNSLTRFDRAAYVHGLRIHGMTSGGE